MIDIVDVKQEVKAGRLKAVIHGNEILLTDTKNGESVKIGEVKDGAPDA